MTRLGVREVISADGDYDALTEIRRLDPAAIDAWYGEVAAA